ncbi:hypothetical protein ACWGK1_06995 [Streptomyces wedmorensis]
MYGFSGTADSSANLYYEADHALGAWAPGRRSRAAPSLPAWPSRSAPAPTSPSAASPSGATHVTHWPELECGGNFLALEQPEVFVADVRAFFRPLAA